MEAFVECFEDFGYLAQASFLPRASGRKLRRKDYKVLNQRRIDLAMPRWGSMVEEDLNGLVSTIAALSGFSNPMKETYYRPASIGQIAKLRGQIEKIPELVSLCRKISLLFSRTMYVRVLHPSDIDKLGSVLILLGYNFKEAGD